VVINVGRGPLIREQALDDALATGVIASAALDVWYADPDPNGRGAPAAHPFRELRNLLMTPHSSGVTRHTFVGRVRDITDNIRRLDAGQTVLRTVRPGQDLYRNSVGRLNRLIRIRMGQSSMGATYVTRPAT
jgi:phosphoglycerate dehydrogenase-like enzyme